MSQTLINVISTPDQLESMLTELIKRVAVPAMPEAAARLEVLKRKETLTTAEVEELYGLKSNTLRKQRINGEGPVFCKDGERVFYTHTAIRKYIEARSQKTYG